MAIMARQLMCALLPIGCRILSHPMSIGRCKRRLARTCKLRCGGSLNKARSRVNGLDSVVEGVCKNPFHSVHIVRKSIANLSVKRMGVVEGGYDPQGDFSWRGSAVWMQADLGERADFRFGELLSAGLYLQIRPRAQSWIYRFRLNGRSRDMGLGSLADVGLIR